MKDCVRRSSRADGVQHSGRPSQGAGRECDYAHGVRTLLSKVPIPITILISIQKQCQYHQYRYQCRHNTNTSIFHQNFYPSFDHPDHAGTIECNFVLGKADDHFQSWWVINYRISWCITFHMPITYWQWHVTTYQYYLPHVNFVLGKASDYSQSWWVVDYHILSLCPRHFLKTKIDIWDCHDHNQSYGQNSDPGLVFETSR